jgi:hypothetical protein
MAKPAEMRRHTRARRPLNPSLKRLQARRAVKNKQLGSLRRGSECIKISSRYIGTESDAKALMRKLAKGTNLQRLRLRAAAASAALSFNFMTIPSRRTAAATTSMAFTEFPRQLLQGVHFLDDAACSSGLAPLASFSCWRGRGTAGPSH